MANKKHIQSKAETSLIESTNFILRHYLARFFRKSIRYSKSIDYLYDSIILLFVHKKRLIEKSMLDLGEFVYNKILNTMVG